MICLTICSSCKFPDREYQPERFTREIEDALRQAGLADAVRVRQFACMGVCSRPVTIALQGDGMATCIFAGVLPETDMSDVVATCQTYLDSPNGWIEDARPCGRLRFCLTARVPAPDDLT